VILLERICIALLLVYAAWLPMPFGSNVDWAFLPLILPPMILCALAAMIWLRRAPLPYAPAAWKVWTAGAILFIAIVALQLVPLPRPLLAVVSPSSANIWTSAERIASPAGVVLPAGRPVSVNPEATRHELLRLIALFAAMQAASMLITTNVRRLLFAAALSLTAIFETLYGVREAALRRYAIWGWVNRLIFDRVTGTFVNPNHFAHYLAIVLPMALFLKMSRRARTMLKLVAGAPVAGSSRVWMLTRPRL